MVLLIRVKRNFFMRMTSFTDYSLRVLIFLALKGDERSSVAEIADKYHVSKNHLVKVVHNLSKLGFVTSFKGKGGGLILAIPSHELNLGKLISALEGRSNLLECFSDSGACVINPVCSLKVILQKAEREFFKSLETYTLEDLVRNKSKLRLHIGS